jgi:dihydroflavonol-4-reductase
MTGAFPGILRMGWGMVDVRDVALSHVLAMENENANGRYICCNKTLWMREARPTQEIPMI